MQFNLVFYSSISQQLHWKIKQESDAKKRELKGLIRIINTPNGYATNVSALVTQNYESIEKDLSALCIPTGSIPVSIDLYRWGDDNALYLTIAASEEFAQFQQRLYDSVMLRNMYGHNGFVIKEEFPSTQLEASL
ncbi:hypothetical protein Q3G72_022458 [Acer saccharum]|nr:hypothetical protein Q3G72_022458 [Acer saccharum]